MSAEPVRGLVALIAPIVSVCEMSGSQRVVDFPAGGRGRSPAADARTLWAAHVHGLWGPGCRA